MTVKISSELPKTTFSRQRKAEVCGPCLFLGTALFLPCGFFLYTNFDQEGTYVLE